MLARRLSNAEFDYTIGDLTGVDIRPTREFPVDPANEAGFDNSGESLAMSPALLKKYLAAGGGSPNTSCSNQWGSTSHPSPRSPKLTATSTACGGSSRFTSTTRLIMRGTSWLPGDFETGAYSASRTLPWPNLRPRRV